MTAARDGSAGDEAARDEAARGLAIRRAGPGDVDVVRALTRAAYAKWVPSIGREPLPMIADFETAVREHLVELLVAPAGVVGLVELIPEDGVLLVENLAVGPEHQGRGHGRRLMAHAEAVAASLGLGCVRLYTNRMFAENVALYLRLGFTVTREEPFRGGVIVHMAKTLGGASDPSPRPPPA